MSQVSANISLRCDDVSVASRAPSLLSNTSNLAYPRGVGSRTKVSLETYLTSKSYVTEGLASGNAASTHEVLRRLQAKERAVDALVQKMKGR